MSLCLFFSPFFISFSAQSHTRHPPPIHQPQKRITPGYINDLFTLFLNGQSLLRLEGSRHLYNLPLLRLEVPQRFPRLLITGVKTLSHVQKVRIKSAPFLECP